jgi:hypothetical protein
MKFVRGTYTGPGGNQYLVMRFDLDDDQVHGLDMVSGDLFDGNAPLEARFAWTVQGVDGTLSVSDDGLTLAADVNLTRTYRDWDRNDDRQNLLKGRLQCERRGDAVFVELSWVTPNNRRESVMAALQRDSAFLRSVTWTVDVIDGLLDPSRGEPAQLGRLLDTSRSLLAGAGVEVLSNGQITRLAGASPDFVWDDANLRYVLQQRYDRIFDRGDLDWRFYLLVAGKYHSPRTTGVMFDTGDDYQRQGAAVFWKTRQRLSGEYFERDFARSVVHEVGHIFNLRHSFEQGKRFGLKRASLSFMNYPEEYDAGNNRRGPGAYWSAYENDKRFEVDEESFIRHGHFEEVVMGGIFYGYGGHERSSGAMAPEVGSDGLRLQLRLKPDRPKNVFEFGEPISVEAKLHNVSGEDQMAVDSLAPVHQLTAYLLETPRGRQEVFRPHMVRCDQGRDQVLKPAAAIYEDVQLSFGCGKWYTLEPGRYRVQGIYAGSKFPIRSKPLTFWVRTPTRAMEDVLFEVFTDDAARYFAAWGDAHCRSAVEPLQKLADPKLDLGLPPGHRHPLWHHYQRCECRITLRGHFKAPAEDAFDGVHLPFEAGKLDRTAWKDLLMLNNHYKFVPKDDCCFTNVAYSTMAVWFAEALRADKDNHFADEVIEAVSAFHKKYNNEELKPSVREQLRAKTLRKS